MKLHLPKMLLASLIAAVCAQISYADVETKQYTVNGSQKSVTTFTGTQNNINAQNQAVNDGTETNMIGFETTGGYFANSDINCSRDIYISKGSATGDTKTGMVISNGNEYKTYTFSGAVYGDGDIYKSGNPANGLTLKFTGDMGAYSGNTEITGANGNNKLIYDGATTGTGTITSNGLISMNNATINNSSISTTGTLRITGTTSIASALTLSDIRIELGNKLDVSAEGASISFGANTIIDLKAADLLAGNFNGTVSYDHKSADTAGSGYLRVVNLELFTDSSKVSGSNITVNIHGATASIAPGNKVTATFNGAYGVASDATYTTAVMGAADLLILDNSAALTFTETPTAVTDGVLVKGADTKIILSGKETELNQSDISFMTGGKTKIQGDGKFTMSAASSNLDNTGISLGDEWSGTVVYSYSDKNNALTTNLAKLGNEDSTIALKGASGHIGTTSGGLSGLTLELCDDGVTKALTISNGSSRASEDLAVSEATSYLAAKVKGSGSIIHNASSLSSNFTGFTFEGDLSEWTGSFSLSTKNLVLRFGGDASLVKASIGKTGGTLNLKVGNTSKKTTFTNTVAVDSISVDADNTMSLGGTTTTTDLTLGEGATLDFAGGTMSVANSITLSTVTVSDLSRYFNADDLSVDLLTVTGADQSITGWSGAVDSGAYLTDGSLYTSSIDQSGNSIVLTFAQAETLEVSSASLAGDVLTLNIAADLSNMNAVNLTLSDEALAFIDGKYGEVTLTLVGSGDTGFSSLDAGKIVSFYGKYVGEGNGVYRIEYIPEPTTATLSLLALAGLAARRRRK